jgi:hypothetical protein
MYKTSDTDDGSKMLVRPVAEQHDRSLMVVRGCPTQRGPSVEILSTNVGDQAAAG